MRTIINLTLLAIVISVTSCSKYYINTLSSTNIQRDQENGGFKYENDSVSIYYSFRGENAPVHITVENKLGTPLYVDWSRSALIMNGKAVSYKDNQIHIAGSTSSDTWRWNRDLSVSNGYFGATANLPEGMTFIPPRSKIEKVPLNVTNGPLDKVKENLYTAKELAYLESGAVTVRTATFTKETSPLLFRSYLTFYAVNGKELKPSSVEHEFFVSKSSRTTTNPENLPDYQSGRSDMFIVKQ